MAQAPGSTTTAPRRRPVHAVLKIVDVVEQCLAALCVLTILVLVSIQVFQRVTAVSSFVWTGEIAKYAMVWMTYLPMAHLLRHGHHLRLDVIEEWLSPRGEAIMARVTDALIGIVCLGLLWAGWALLNAPFLGSSPAVRIPLFYVYLGPVIGIGLTAVSALYLAVVGRDPDEPATDDLAEVQA